MKFQKKFLGIIKKTAVAVLCVCMFLTVIPLGFFGEVYANIDNSKITIELNNKAGTLLNGFNVWLTYGDGEIILPDAPTEQTKTGQYVFSVKPSDEEYYCFVDGSEYQSVENVKVSVGMINTITLFTKTPTVTVKSSTGEIGSTGTIYADIGSKVTLTVTAEDGVTENIEKDESDGKKVEFIYQWYKGEDKIDGATSSVYLIGDITDESDDDNYTCAVYSTLAEDNKGSSVSVTLKTNKFTVAKNKLGWDSRPWVKNGDILYIAPIEGYQVSQYENGYYDDKAIPFYVYQQSGVYIGTITFYVRKDGDTSKGEKCTVEYKLDSTKPTFGSIKLDVGDEDKTWKRDDSGYGVIVEAQDSDSGIQSVSWTYNNKDYKDIKNPTEPYSFSVSKEDWLKYGRVEVIVTDAVGNKTENNRIVAIGTGFLINNGDARGYNNDGEKEILVSKEEYSADTVFYVSPNENLNNFKRGNYVVFTGLDRESIKNIKNLGYVEIKNGEEVIWRSNLNNGATYSDSNGNKVKYNNCLINSLGGMYWNSGLAYYKLKDGSNKISISVNYSSDEHGNCPLFSDICDIVQDDYFALNEIVVDGTAPIITANYDEPIKSEAVDKKNYIYFDKKTSVEILIEEENFDAANTTLSVKRNRDEDVSPKKVAWEYDSEKGKYKTTVFLGGEDESTIIDGQYEIAVESKDKAGNTGEFTSCTIVVDGTAPKITANYLGDYNTEENEIEGKKYKTHFYKNVASVEILIEEENFDAANTNVSVSRDGGDYYPIDVKWTPSADDDGTYYTTVYLGTEKKGGKGVEDIVEGKYAVSVTSTDKVGHQNESFCSDTIVVDVKKPEISVNYLGNPKTNKEEKTIYYNDVASVEIIIEEENFDAANTMLSVKRDGGEYENSKEFAWKYDSDIGKYKTTVYLGEETEKTNEAEIIKDNGEGKYEISVTSTDKARNTTTINSEPIVIDKTSPSISAEYVDRDPESNDEIIIEDFDGITYRYYGEKTSVNIVVTEKNFDATNTKVYVSRDGKDDKLVDVTWTSYENQKEGIYYSYTTVLLGVEKKDEDNAGSAEDNGEGKYVISVTSTDKAGNSFVLDENEKQSDVNSADETEGDEQDKFVSDTIIIDKTDPIVTIEYDDEADKPCRNSEGKILSDNAGAPIYEYREITVTIEDPVSGIKGVLNKYISQSKPDNDENIGVYTEIALDNTEQDIGDGWEVASTNGCFVTKVKKTFVFGTKEEEKYGQYDDNSIKEYISATDRTGNADNNKTNVFTIDQTKPQIIVALGPIIESNNKVQDDVPVPLGNFSQVNSFYNKARKAIITVSERNFNKDLDLVHAFVNEEKRELDFSKLDKDKYIYTTVIEFNEDGPYSFSVDGIDLAGHIADVTYDGDDPNNFTVDTVSPIIEGIYNMTPNGIHDTNNKIYYKNQPDFVLSVNEINFQNDGDNTPVNITYKDANGETTEYKYSIENWESENNINNGNIVFENDGTYVINASSNDKAGNLTSFTSETMVIDTSAPVVTVGVKEDVEKPCLDSDRNQLKDGNGNPIYKYREITITVEDTGSGIQKLSYKYGDEKKQHYSNVELTKDELYKEHNVGDILTDGWIVDSVDGLIVTKIHKKFVFGVGEDSETESMDDNDIQLSIVALNNSGSATDEIKAKETFTIDQTNPQISVDFGDDEDEDTYYASYRQATVTVVERNFDKTKITANIKNENGEVPALSDFEDKGNYTYTAKVIFKDGDYSFSVEGKDMAGNKADVVYTGGNEKHFFVDTVTPVVTTNFADFVRDKVEDEFDDNNDFNTAKTAEITVNDHNFDPTKTNLKVYYKASGSIHSNDNWEDHTGMYDGDWKDNGDIHTTSIVLSMDGVYRMEIAPVDKAGNRAELITSEIFEIDTTVPVISARNGMHVEANSTEFFDVYYYERKDEPAPTIEFSDNNFEYIEYDLIIWSPEISEDGILTGYQGKNIYVDEDIAERGRITSTLLTMPDFENEGDGVYELSAFAVDSAGNRSEINYDTYARIIDNDVIAYIDDSNVEKQTGLYSFTYEDLTPISMRPDRFKDIMVVVIARNNSDVDVVLRDTNGYETAVKAVDTKDDSIEGFTIHNIAITSDYFKDTFADDIDTEVYLSVKNTVRDGNEKEVKRIDLGKIHIDSIVPTCTAPKEFKSWHWFFGNDSRTITMTDISELLNEEECIVYDNGSPIDFEYDAIAGTLTFNIEQGWHDIGVCITDIAGNANNISEVKRIQVGYFWLWVIIGGVCVVAGVVIVIAVRNAKKRREAED